MSSSHRVCIVGAGERGRAHANAWQKFGAQIIGVVDVDENRADRLAKDFGAQAFTNYQDALSTPGLDIVSVCVPAALHPEVVIASARLGKV